MTTPRPWNYGELIDHEAKMAMREREILEYTDGYKTPSPLPVHVPQPIRLWKPWGEVVWDKSIKQWRVLILRTQEVIGRRRRRIDTAGSYHERTKAQGVLRDFLKREWADYHQLKGMTR